MPEEVTGLLRRVDIMNNTLELEDEEGQVHTYEFATTPRSADYYLVTVQHVTLKLEDGIVQDVLQAP